MKAPNWLSNGQDTSFALARGEKGSGDECPVHASLMSSDGGTRVKFENENMANKASRKDSRTFFGLVVMNVVMVIKRKRNGRSKEGEPRLGATLELAPALFEATASHVASTIGHGTSAAGGVGACRRVLAGQAAVGSVVAVDHVASASTADVIDGGSAAQVPLKFFVEAEDGAFAAAVDVTGTTAAGSVGRGTTRVEASQGGRTSGRSRVGGLGILQADDITAATPASVQSRTIGRWHRRVWFDHPVASGSCGRHGECMC